MRNKILLLLFCLLIQAGLSFAQNNYSLSGKVIDEHRSPVENGVVQLLNASDSITVKYSFIDKGNFSFDLVKEGSYLIHISSLGYEEKIQPVTISGNAAVEISLKTSTMEEATVVSDKNMFSYKDGNTKVNIENTILSKEANTVDLLSKLPMVQISSDKEAITLIGKGDALLYINNQRATVNDLNSLAVDDIKTIEIINNPSVKYEAEGRAVILITTKRSNREGFQIDLNETASIKRYYQNQSGLNLNFKKKRWEFKSNFQFNRLMLWEGNSSTFKIAGTNIQSGYNVYSLGPRRQFIFGGGLYYQINKDDYISLSASKRYQDEPFKIETTSNYEDDTSNNSILTHTDNISHRPFFTSTLNYDKTFKKINAELFLGAQYSNFTRELNTTIYNNFNNSGSVLDRDQYQNFHVDVYAAKSDFEKKFKKHDLKEDCGVNFSQAMSNAVLSYQNFIPVSNINSNSNFNYRETDLAAYNQLSGKLKKVSWQAGVRAENTQIQGGYKNVDTLVINKNFLQLFPKGSIDIPIDSTKSLSFNYARSIERPDYSTANQITSYINPYFEFASNIDIQPSIRDEVSVNFQLNDKSIGLSFYQRQNPVYFIATYNATQNKVSLVNENLRSEKGVDLTFNLPLKYKIWSSSTFIVASLSRLKDPAAVAIPSKPYTYFYSRHQFALPKGYTFVLSGWMLTKRYQGIFESHSIYHVDLGLSKTFFKKLNLTVSYNDIFRSGTYKENFTINQVVDRSTYFDDDREFAVSLSYSFGKIKDSKYQNKDADENSDRIK